ncbi:MAG TPA: 3'-5' exonuclease [Burkholderiaceae bacterium]|nr:3'-5' exonuclease [Burkholderiaceae bacterium]
MTGRWSRWWRGASGERSGDGALGQDERWVVVDVESTGLDARRDRLLAIAAIAVHVQGGHARIALGDSFDVVLRQPEAAQPPDKDNILLHGIGVGAQREGTEPREALLAFERYLAGAPLIAFHAAFDETMIGRACRRWLQRKLPNEWVDLMPVARVLAPQVPAQTLDDWMAHFGIRCLQRHQAAADTLATAELLLCLWPRLRAHGPAGFRTLRTLAAQSRWLPS